MRPIDVKTLKYGKNSPSNRRHRVRVWVSVVGLMIVALLVLFGYIMFYTHVLRITEIKISGTTSQQHEQEIRTSIEQSLNKRILGIPMYRNLFFYNSDWIANILPLNYIQSLDIHKDFPHTFIVKITERQPEGVWCFQSDCRYFDHSGVTWGNAIQSSGFLLLNIDDGRVSSSSARTGVDQRFLQAIQTVTSGLNNQNIKIKKVTIPPESYTEFDILVSDGYPIKFSLDSDLAGQLKVYEIFRNQKLSIGDFRPLYLDLRFDGRVYFK